MARVETLASTLSVSLYSDRSSGEIIPPLFGGDDPPLTFFQLLQPLGVFVVEAITSGPGGFQAFGLLHQIELLGRFLLFQTLRRHTSGLVSKFRGGESFGRGERFGLGRLQV